MNSSRNPYQQRSGGMSGRAMRALLLCLLLPPIGLFYMWHNNVFRFKGRVVISAFCCVEMMLLFSWGLFGLVDWHTMPDTVLLADFAQIGRATNGADLGCASGALMLLLLFRATPQEHKLSGTPWLRSELLPYHWVGWAAAIALSVGIIGAMALMNFAAIPA